MQVVDQASDASGEPVDALSNMALSVLLPHGRALPTERSLWSDAQRSCHSKPAAGASIDNRQTRPAGRTGPVDRLDATRRRKLCRRQEAPVSGTQDEDVACSIWPAVDSQAHALQRFTHCDVSVESLFGACFAIPGMPPNANRWFLVPGRSTSSRSRSAPCPSGRAVSDALHPMPGPPVAGASQVAAPTRPCRLSVPACPGTESP